MIGNELRENQYRRGGKEDLSYSDKNNAYLLHFSVPSELQDEIVDSFTLFDLGSLVRGI